MCGITGFWARPNLREEQLLTKLRAATDIIEHRGPDDDGHWVDPQSGMALGFRRLSIIDLSQAGHQPMQSFHGRYWMTFNGEVYNAFKFRDELIQLGFKFRGHSDTEIMLAMFEAWGVETSVKKLIGMFGIALWDTQERVLTLIRDRVGIKPMHYGFVNGCLAWGSELKSIEVIAEGNLKTDDDAVDEFMHYGYISAPRTIYKDVKKIFAGQMLRFHAPDEEPEAIAYWSMSDVVENGRLHRLNGSDQDAIDSLEAILRDSIDLRMLADVPLGAFLSGGIDSSTVVALMQSISSKPVKTFTIGFEEARYDESAAARAIAKHLGTEHHEMIVTSKEAQDVIPMLSNMYDEPFADSSQIPTYLVSKLARKHVTVSLSGDGGDEMFTGYNRYRFHREAWEKLKKLPKPLRSVMSAAILAQPTEVLNVTMAPIKKLAERSGAPGPIGQKMRKLATVMKSADAHELIQAMSVAGAAHNLLNRPAGNTARQLCIPKWMTEVEEMQYEDALYYMTEDILCKVDRASMAVSLEGRVPILDHRVIEYAWSLPESLKLRGTEGKWILKQVLYKHVPKELMDRPKTGFGIPVGLWIRNELRDWAESLLNESAVNKVGILDAKEVRKCLDQHQSGACNWEPSLWKALMLQAWGLNPRKG